MSTAQTKKLIEDGIGSLYRIQAEKDHIAEIVLQIVELGVIDKKAAKALITFAYKKDLAEKLESLEEIKAQLECLGLA